MRFTLDGEAARKTTSEIAKARPGFDAFFAKDVQGLNGLQTNILRITVRSYS